MKIGFENCQTLLGEIEENKTKVTSVNLVLFEHVIVMSFETLTKVDRLTEIVRFGKVFSQRIVVVTRSL